MADDLSVGPAPANPEGTPQRRRLRRRWILLALFLPCAFYLYWYSGPDPRITLARLKGLSTVQVVSRLGVPDAIRPAAPGQVIFDYSNEFGWEPYSYGVVFKNNHVINVAIGSH